MRWEELEYRLKSHARRGGKTSRRRQVDRVRQFIKFCRDVGVRGPDQIGKSQLHQWYEETDLAESTLRDRYYAASLLWEFLDRGVPPKPHSKSE